MKYFIFLLVIFYSELYAPPKNSQPKLIIIPKKTIHTFYNAVRANDTQAISEHLQENKSYPLTGLAKTAAKKKHKESLLLLLSAGARPPLYEVAQQGQTNLALITLQHLSNLCEPLTPKAKEHLIKRLSKTGNTKLLHMYFDSKVLSPEDVSHAGIAGATQGSKMYAALVEKRFAHSSETCAICITNFTEKETRTSNLLLKCGHMFHEECRDKWFKKRPTCPLCKKKVRPKKSSCSS